MSNALKGNRTYFEAIELLPDRAFGGANVADSGVDDGDWLDFFIEGPLAAGAAEAVTWFREKIETPTPLERNLLFLVGAPGNGKSHIASEIQRGLAEVGDKTLLKHHRKHEYLHKNGQNVSVINDATIPSIDQFGAVVSNSLIEDIERAITANNALLVNVNRGILFEEIQASENFGIGQAILEFLSSANQGELPDGWSIRSSKVMNVDDALASIVFCSEADDIEVNVLCVRVDSYSMLEERPEVTELRNGRTRFPCMGTSYRVKRFANRDVDYCDVTPVGLLLSKFFASEHFPDPESNSEIVADPFAANLENFRSESFRQGFQNILRAAELVNSQKLTYRELWGAVSAAMIGSKANPVSWLKANQPNPEVGIDRLQSFMALASCRSHQSIFGASCVVVGVDLIQVRTPLTALTSKIDPAIDATPGQHAQGSSGWASCILEAFQSQAEGESVLRAAKELMEAVDDSALLTLTAFDWQLDEIITISLAGSTTWLKDNEKQLLVAWYGEYLVRLYALTHGIPAFHFEIQKLTDTWANARSQGTLEMTTASAVRTLLLPFYSQDVNNRPILLPLFNGRTEPIVERTENPKLVLRAHDRLDFKIETASDGLSIELWADSDMVGKMALDFALLREALACVANNVGYTELGESLTPRIERFRSSMLHNRPSNGYYSVYGPSITRITQD